MSQVLDGTLWQTFRDGVSQSDSCLVEVDVDGVQLLLLSPAVSSGEHGNKGEMIDDRLRKLDETIAGRQAVSES